MNEEHLARFMDRVQMIPEVGCWIWTSTTINHGYGTMSIKHRIRVAHALAYEHFVGPIPDGLELDHKCRTPSCVNPDHVEPVTHQENMRRGAWGRRTHCKHGHPFSGPNLFIQVRRGLTRRCCRQCFVDRYARIRAVPEKYAAKLAYWKERNAKRRAARIGIQYPPVEHSR